MLLRFSWPQEIHQKENDGGKCVCVGGGGGISFGNLNVM